MKNKKGFTLIELMAVVAILGIISTITVASINYSIKQSKQKLYVEQIARLEKGVENWAINNSDKLPLDSSGIVFFSISKLKDEQIVDSELIINPIDNEELDGCMTIQYDASFNQYDYQYETGSCTAVSDAYKPDILVVGGNSQYVEVNSLDYIIPEATATDYTGRSIASTGPIIKKGANIVTSFDFGLVGDVYTLTYTAKDEKLNLTTEEVVTLTVNDTIAPVITCNGNTTSYSEPDFEAAPVYPFPTCVVTDNSCGLSGSDNTVNGCITTLSPQISGGVTPTVVGPNYLNYLATDSSANATPLVVTIGVVDTTGPDITTTPTYTLKLDNSSGAIYDSNWTNHDIWVGNIVAVDAGVGVKNYQYSVNCTGTYTNLADGVNNFVVTTAPNQPVCLKAVDNIGNISSVALTTTNLKIDKSNPSVPTLTVSEAWTNAASVSGTIAGSTDAESGILRYEYSMSGATTLGWTAGAAFSVTAVGQTTVTVRAVNGAGGYSSTTSKIVKIERTAPVCGSWSPATSPWKISGTQGFTLSGSTDAGGSLINVSGGSCTTGSANGNTCTVGISDMAGNTATCTSPINRVDTTAPSVPTLTVIEYWTNIASVAGTIAGSTDAESGILRYEYSMTGATVIGWTSGAAFSVTAAGQTTVTVRAVNGAGAYSTTTSKVVSIDRTAPVCGSWSPATSPWKASGTQGFTLSGSTDAGGSLINVSGGSCTTGSANGNTCTVAISDWVANSTTCTSPINRVDISAPSTPTFAMKINTSGGTVYAQTWTNQNVWFGTFASSDGESGIVQYEYSMSGATTLGWTVGSTFTVTNEGTTNIAIRALSGAGTYSGNAGATVYIDRTLPAVSVVPHKGSPGGANYTSNWTNQTLYYVWTATDANSGINAIECDFGSTTACVITPNASLPVPLVAGATSWSTSDYWAATRNDTIAFRVQDRAGNWSIYGAYPAIKIDKSGPNINGTYTLTDCTSTSTVSAVLETGWAGFNNTADGGANYSTTYLRKTGTVVGSWGVTSQTATCGQASCVQGWEARDTFNNISTQPVKAGVCESGTMSGSF